MVMIVTVDRCSYSNKEGFTVDIPDGCYTKTDKNDTEEINGAKVSVIKVYRLSDNVQMGTVSRTTKLYVPLCTDCDTTTTVNTAAPITPAVTQVSTAAGCTDCEKTIIPVKELSLWEKIKAKIMAWLKLS
jgi:hypothetical protein